MRFSFKNAKHPCTLGLYERLIGLQVLRAPFVFSKGIIAYKYTGVK
jgi:hypothetical protein